jgi:putative transposase
MPEISQSFFRAAPGDLVAHAGKKYRISCLISVDSILAEEVETGSQERLRIEMVTPWSEPAVSETGIAVIRDTSSFSNEEWAEAQRRLQAIKPLLDNPIRTRSSVEAQAEKFGVNATTLYKWLKIFQTAGHVSSLVPEKRGRKQGTLLLGGRQEAIVQTAIEDLYLSKQRHKPQDVVEEVMRRCRLAEVPAPHANTVRARIASLNPALALRRRGQKDVARNRYAPIQGSFPGGERPFSVVQIDHTPADIIVVDEVHRKPIGRPWMTLAIDVHSRMIAGLYLTFEKPSFTSVGICLARAICPKREFLAARDVTGDWPVWGVMQIVHSDNGKEFRGGVLQRACEEYDIDLQWRPVLQPHFGGHIERLMGTMANQLRKLPGTTFSNTAQRKGYNSEKEAALTLRELEKHLLEFIVNVYHQKPHSELGMSPLRKWSIGVVGTPDAPGVGVMPVPRDPLKVQLDFMPFFMRSVQQYGVQIDNIFYYAPVLNAYINAADPDNAKAKREFLIRRDPTDISKVYFLDPADGRYTELPYRNIGLPPISVWELREIQARLKAEGRRDIDENLIFEAVTRMRQGVEQSVHKTKAARRLQARNPAQFRAPSPPKPKAEDTTTVSLHELNQLGRTEVVLNDDPFAAPIVPFEEVLVSR